MVEINSIISIIIIKETVIANRDRLHNMTEITSFNIRRRDLNLIFDVEALKSIFCQDNSQFETYFAGNNLLNVTQ